MSRSPSFAISCLALAVGVAVASPASARDNVLRVAWGAAGDEVLAVTSTIPDVLTGRILVDNPQPPGSMSRLFFKFSASNGGIVQVTSSLGAVNEIAPSNYELAPPGGFTLAGGTTTEVATFQVAIADTDRIDILLYSGRLTDPTGTDWALDTQFRDILAAWVNAGEPEISALPLVFETIGINREPLVHGRTVRNNGNGPFFFDRTVLADPCGPFRITNADGTYLLMIRPDGGGKSVNVEFAPTQAGQFSCNLPLGGDAVLPVQGAGRLPIHALTATPTMLDFGEVAVGGVGRVTFDVLNEGDYTESHAGIVSGDGTPLTAESINGIPPGHDWSIDLTYRPTDYDRHDWVIDYGGLVSVSATAVGIDGVLVGNVQPDTLRLSTPIGTTSSDVTFWVTNDGTVSFTPEPLWVGDATYFELDGRLPELILPGGYQDMGVRYTAVDDVPRVARLSLGADLPVLVVTGRGRVDHPAIEVRPQVLELPPTAVGDTVTGVVAMENTGNSWINLDLQSTDPRLTISGGSNGMNPGGYSTFEVRYIAQAYEQLDARVVVDYELAADVNVVGPPIHPFAADENRLSLFFDEAFTTPETTVPPAPQALTAWLVLGNPSAPGGVAAWTCRLEASDGALLAEVVPSGSVFDAAAAADEFAITVLGSPLPPSSAIVLAEALVFVLDPDVTEARLMVRGLAESPLPGLPTWTPGAPGAPPLAMAASPGALTIGTVRLVDPASGVGDVPPVARSTRLLPNVPNPFNPRTEIRFEVGVPGPVAIRVYDVIGRLVRELAGGSYPAGRHAVAWDGRDRSGRIAASGTYYVRLEGRDTADARKILLLK